MFRYACVSTRVHSAKRVYTWLRTRVHGLTHNGVGHVRAHAAVYACVYVYIVYISSYISSYISIYVLY